LKDLRGKKLSLSASIQHLDEKLGLHRPIIVLGFACLKRCVSVRSDHRVITHAILNMSPKSVSSNMQQLYMRAAGFTKHLRSLNGFDRLELKCRKEDSKIVKSLYTFTETVLRMSGTGNIADLSLWMSAEVSGEC
jgi:hypothetical protein